MFLYTIWYAGILLNLIILGRGVVTRLYVRFPIFYIYSGAVFASSVWGLLAYRSGQTPYFYVFWSWQIISIVLGYGVVLEITHLAFKNYPGAEKFARYLGFLAFGAIFLVAGIAAKLDKIPDFQNHLDGFERDLRVVQAIFLFIVAVVVLHYGIELGKNLSGLAIGFGIYIAAAIVNMALSVEFGVRYYAVFSEAQSVAYLLTLGVWTVALWSPAKVKSTPPNAQLEADYEAMAAKTKERLKALRSHFTPMTSLW
jgi:hypothetical protein